MSKFEEYLKKIKPTRIGIVVLVILIIGLPLLIDLLLMGTTSDKMFDRFSFLKFSLSGFVVIGVCIVVYLAATFLIDQIKERFKF